MTRYTVTNQKATEAFLEPSPDGNWAWYPDAAAELEALQSKCAELQAVVNHLHENRQLKIEAYQERDSLRTQNRELREACVKVATLQLVYEIVSVERGRLLQDSPQLHEAINSCNKALAQPEVEN